MKTGPRMRDSASQRSCSLWRVRPHLGVCSNFGRDEDEEENFSSS